MLLRSIFFMGLMNYGEACLYEFITSHLKRKLPISNNLNFFLWLLVDEYYILTHKCILQLVGSNICVKLITNIDYFLLWFIYSAECNRLSGYPCSANTVRWCCVKFEARHLRKMVAALRDSLMRRILGIFHQVKMTDSLNPQKELFCDRLYIAAAVLDPNQKLLWVDHDVHVSHPDSFEDDDDPNRIANVKTALKGNLLMFRCTKNLEY